MLAQAFNLCREGKAEQAAKIYRAVLASNADNPVALNNLAVLLRKNGRADDAQVLLERAVSIAPDNFDALYNLGNGFLNGGALLNAVDCYRKALAANPQFVPALLNLGIALRRAHRALEAVDVFRRALSLRENDPRLHLNIALALEQAGLRPAAAAHLHRADELAGHDDQVSHELAAAFLKLDLYDDAEKRARFAVQAKHASAEAHAILGQILCSKGQFDLAVESLRQALALDDANVTAHLGLARSLLLAGDLPTGWTEYRWRWRHKTSDPYPKYDKPQWDGRDPKGNTILIHTEQGLGDAIQFIRYAPIVAKRGARVIVRCQPSLSSLFGRVPGIDRVLAPTEDYSDFDSYIPLLELPGLLGTNLSNIPNATPYFDVGFAPDGRRNDSPRIGIVWAGSSQHENDHNRSLHLTELLPLLGLPNVRYVSLQESAQHRREIAEVGAGSLLDDAGAKLTDFLATARIIQGLDLIISVDTAVAHLAGALAKPVWTLLPFAPDWRWMSARFDTPWYPTMRLYRQTCPGYWGDTINRVKEDLARDLRGTWRRGT